MENSLIDAGPLIALFDKSDQYHEAVIGFLKGYSGRLTSTWPVLTEVSYMLDFSKETQLDFIDWVIEGGISVFNLEQWQLKRVREIMDAYADLPADFADATLLVAAESQRIKHVITIDRDFEIYRLADGTPLELLFSP